MVTHSLQLFTFILHAISGNKINKIPYDKAVKFKILILNSIWIVLWFNLLFLWLKGVYLCGVCYFNIFIETISVYVSSDVVVIYVALTICTSHQRKSNLWNKIHRGRNHWTYYVSIVVGPRQCREFCTRFRCLQLSRFLCFFLFCWFTVFVYVLILYRHILPVTFFGAKTNDEKSIPEWHSTWIMCPIEIHFKLLWAGSYSN